MENRVDQGLSVFTRILIVVQVLAASQSESIARQAPAGGPGCLQFLAQNQALRGYVPVTIKDQYPASTLLPSKRTAHCHVCSVDNQERHEWFKHQRG